MMKKLVYLLFICVLLGSLTGCSKQGNPDASGKQEGAGEGNPAKTEVSFVSEDYSQCNPQIRGTDKGYYYLNRGLRYVDAATGKDMYLCNKPECRHDGNEFCVATNKKYRFDRLSIYSGALLATVIEETDTQYQYKLFSIALDGSQMNELTTYYTFEKGDGQPWYLALGPLVVHRNKVILPIALKGQEALEDTYYYGTAMYDMDTKEVIFLDEEPVSKENPERTDISAYGDYVYYCQQEGKKTVLHRRHMTDGTDESYKLLTGFRGNYVVVDEDTVAYAKWEGRALCVNYRETGMNEEKANVYRPAMLQTTDGQGMEWVYEDELSSLRTDGTYLYAFGSHFEVHYKTEEVYGSYDYLHVFNRDLEEIATLNLADFTKDIRIEGVEEELHLITKYMSIKEDDVYWFFMPKDNYSDKYVYKCSLSDLLAGKPQLEYVYSDTYKK